MIIKSNCDLTKQRCPVLKDQRIAFLLNHLNNVANKAKLKKEIIDASQSRTLVKKKSLLSTPVPPVPSKVKFRDIDGFSLISPLVEPFALDSSRIKVSFLLSSKELSQVNLIKDDVIMVCVLRFCCASSLNEDFLPPKDSFIIKLNGHPMNFMNNNRLVKFSKTLALHNRLELVINDKSILKRNIYGGIFLYQTTISNNSLRDIPYKTYDQCTDISNLIFFIKHFIAHSLKLF